MKPAFFLPLFAAIGSTTVYDGALADIYSFGILMWSVLELEAPYEKMAQERQLNL